MCLMCILGWGTAVFREGHRHAGVSFVVPHTGMSCSEQISQNLLYSQRNVRLMCNDAQLPGTIVLSTQQFPDSKYVGYSIPQCSTAPSLSPHTAPTAFKTH